MKPSLVVAVWLALGVYLAPRCEGQSGPGGDKQEADGQKKPRSPVLVPYQINSQWIYTEAQPTGNQTPQRNGPAEWLSIFVGCITIGVIGWQSWETRRSANAAKLAADAALLNAQAVINSERPWIAISVETPEPGKFRWRATNVGRTPANILAIWSGTVSVKRSEPIQLSEGYRNRECLFAYPPCLLPPSATCPVFSCTTEDLLVAGESLVKQPYGKVVYSDTFGPGSNGEHETIWLYLYLPSRGSLPIADPNHPQYNGYT